MTMITVETRRRRPAPLQYERVGRRILVADASPEVCRTLAGGLRRDGYEVVVAEDGESLSAAIMADIELATQLGADYTSLSLILADARLPVFSGMEALAMLRDLEWPTPVVLMTAAADDCTDIEAGRLGAAAVLDKPFDFDEIRALIRYITGRASLV